MGQGTAAVELCRLTIKIVSDSNLLGTSLPIEVRDAHNRRIREGRGEMDMNLPPGIYQVRATLPNGQRSDELVELRARDEIRLRYGGEADESPTETLDAGDSLTAYLDTSPGDEARDVVSLTETRGATVRELDGGWLFEPVSPLVDVPHAVFTTSTGTIRASLPINPAAGFPLDACVVVPVATGRADRLAVRFVRHRLVAANLDGQLRSGAYLDPASFADAAGELLFYKYADPTAAALGGLTLHRLGRLRERVDWVRNLARDFDWLADGRILEIALHAQDSAAVERARWLEKLLEVARMRPMFADGYALLLDLLRRWPDGSEVDRRTEALEEVTSRIVGVDWSATALIEYSADDA